jgi:Mrp family chromosome partitioning ATPase
MPKFFVLKGDPDVVACRALQQLEAFGCRVMSTGFVVEATTVMVWSMPMVASAITQIMPDLDWC